MTPDPAQRRALFAHPAGWIALGFGSGLSPRAPGTIGSLAALLPWLALRELPLPLYALVVAAAFALGVWACDWAVRVSRNDDPGFVVWDEFVGQWLAATPLLWSPHGGYGLLAAFVLFRLFDVLKPWPVSLVDRRVQGGFGVMLDDAIAGLLAAIVLALALAIR